MQELHRKQVLSSGKCWTEKEMVPSSYSSIPDEESVAKMQKMLDMMEDDDDVQNVYHNWDEK